MRSAFRVYLHHYSCTDPSRVWNRHLFWGFENGCICFQRLWVECGRGEGHWLPNKATNCDSLSGQTIMLFYPMKVCSSLFTWHQYSGSGSKSLLPNRQRWLNYYLALIYDLSKWTTTSIVWNLPIFSVTLVHTRLSGEPAAWPVLGETLSNFI